jgi:hypothetical protein
MMRFKTGLFALILLTFLLTSCGNSSFKGGFFAMDIPQTVSHDTWMSRVKRVDNQMTFNNGKVTMRSFSGQTLTCDYEAKDNTISVKLPDGTSKEYYLVDDRTIIEDKLNKDIIWKAK